MRSFINLSIRQYITNTSLTKKNMDDTMGLNKKIRIIDEHGNVTKKNPKKKKETEDFDYTTYLNLGFYLAAPLLILLFVGVQLDNFLHTRPIFTITGIVIGAVASLYNLIRLTKKDASH